MVITTRTEGKLKELIYENLNRIPVEDLEEIRHDAGERIKEQQVKDCIRNNKRRKAPEQYNEGDLIRVERQVPHDGKSQKLCTKYQGLYRIIKVLPNDRFVIKDTPLTQKK